MIVGAFLIRKRLVVRISIFVDIKLRLLYFLYLRHVSVFHNVRKLENSFMETLPFADLE